MRIVLKAMLKCLNEGINECLRMSSDSTQARNAFHIIVIGSSNNIDVFFCLRETMNASHSAFGKIQP